MSDDLNILETYVQHKCGKKWKDRWCVLKKANSFKDGLHLLLYKNHQKVNIKNDFSMNLFIGIAENIPDDSESVLNIIVILCKNISIQLAFNSQETRDTFKETFSKYLGCVHIFEIQIIQSPANYKISPSIKYCLYLNKRLAGIATLSTTSAIPPKIIHWWYLNDMKSVSKTGREYKFHVAKSNGYEDFALLTPQCDLIDLLLKKHQNSPFTFTPLTKISINENDEAAKRLATDDYPLMNFTNKLTNNTNITSNKSTDQIIIKTIPIKLRHQNNCDKNKTVKRKSLIIRRYSLCNLTLVDDNIDPSNENILPSKIMRSISMYTLLSSQKNNKENFPFTNYSLMHDENSFSIACEENRKLKSKCNDLHINKIKKINVESYNPLEPLPFVDMSRFDGASNDGYLGWLHQPPTQYINENIINILTINSTEYSNIMPENNLSFNRSPINPNFVEHNFSDADYIPFHTSHNLLTQNSNSQNYINEMPAFTESLKYSSTTKNNLNQFLPSVYMRMSTGNVFSTLQTNNKNKKPKSLEDYQNSALSRTSLTSSLTVKHSGDKVAFEPLNMLSSNGYVSTPMLPVSKPNQPIYKQILNKFVSNNLKNKTTSVPTIASTNADEELTNHNVNYINYPPLPPKLIVRTQNQVNATLDSIREDDHSNPLPLPVKLSKNSDVSLPPRPLPNNMLQSLSSNGLHTFVPPCDFKSLRLLDNPLRQPNSIQQLGVDSIIRSNSKKKKVPTATLR